MFFHFIHHSTVIYSLIKTNPPIISLLGAYNIHEAVFYSLIKTNPPIKSLLGAYNIMIAVIYSLIKTNPPIISLLGAYNIHEAVHLFIDQNKSTNRYIMTNNKIKLTTST